MTGAGDSRDMDRQGSWAPWVKPQPQQPGVRPGTGLGMILVLVTSQKLVSPPPAESAVRAHWPDGRWGSWGGILNTLLFSFKGLSSPGGK